MSKAKKSAKTADKETRQQAAEAASPEESATVEFSGAEEKVEALTAENDKLRDQMLRARAEFENFKRRRNQEMEQFSQLANEGLIGDLLPILDDFDLMLANAEKSGEAGSLLEGAQMIRQKLFTALEKRGLESIDAKGKPFDPDLHEALMQMPVPGVEAGTIVEVHQPGYRLAGKLIRASRVIVASEADGEN
ncbi:nucleotide exchange factor GrpE [bacterium]|nr:nucleotide exchange factor GrpE [bacterium]